MNAPTRPPSPARRWLGGVLAALLLLAVAAWYLNPQVMLDVADRLWSCF